MPFRHNPHFPINTLMLMRGATGLQMREPARMVPTSMRCTARSGSTRKNMNDPATVGAVLQAAGFDAGQLLALAARPGGQGPAEGRRRRKPWRAASSARPTFFVGDQMFWGQDRLDFVKEALAT